MIFFSAKWTPCLALAVFLVEAARGAEAISRLGATGGRLIGNNATPEVANQDLFSVVPGPYLGVSGIESNTGPFDVRAKLERGVSGRGTFAFWFKSPQTYQSGSRTDDVDTKICSFVGLAEISLEVRSSAVALVVEWTARQGDSSPEEIRILIPEVPGDSWHHLAVVWDDGLHYVNAYLNGEPYYFDGLGVARSAHGEATEIVAHLGRFALAEMTLNAAAATTADIHTMIKQAAAKLPSLLASSRGYSPPSMALPPTKALYHLEMSSHDQTDDWVMEGDGIVSCSEGWTEIKSARPNGPEGHVVYWCPIEFPASFRAEWDFEILEPKGLCIVFFAAAGRAGKDLFDPLMGKRTGKFSEYILGDIDAYHISYFANTPDEPRAVANLRKNRGFFLLANGPVGVTTGRKGEVHHAILVKRAGHITMTVNGRTIIDYKDDGTRAGPILQKGRIGFRQMQWTSVRYRRFIVYPLEEVTSP